MNTEFKCWGMGRRGTYVRCKSQSHGGSKRSPESSISGQVSVCQEGNRTTAGTGGNTNEKPYFCSTLLKMY